MIFNINKQNVWVTSDTHAYHSNICKGSTKWNIEGLDPKHAGVRNFRNPEEMTIELIDQINSNVAENDILIHLGDWSFEGIENIWNFRKQILCKNIYLCYGNHDHHIKNDKPLSNNIIIESDYLYMSQQDLFSYTDHVLDFKVQFNKNKKAERFFCSHYAHRVWDQHHRGVFHLYGHSHSGLEDVPWGRSMDVGMDNAFKLFGEYRPFNIREVYDLLKDRKIQTIDHHK